MYMVDDDMSEFCSPPSPDVVVVEHANTLWRDDAFEGAGKRIRHKLEVSQKPTILVTHHTEPPQILACNKVWRDLCGYDRESIGLSPKCLHGNLTDEATAREFTDRLKEEGSATMTVLNYNKKSGACFAQELSASTVVNSYGDKLYLTEGTVVPAAGLKQVMEAKRKTEKEGRHVSIISILLSFVLVSVGLLLETPGYLENGGSRGGDAYSVPASEHTAFTTSSPPLLVYALSSTLWPYGMAM